MFGGAGLKGRGAMPAIARQRLSAFSRSSRSISSFRPQAARSPARYGRVNQTLTGRLAWRPASALPAMTATRFNSTSSASPPPADAAAATPPTTTTPASDLSDVSVDLASIPEDIGYLKALGLDYGWGPSSLIEYVIEHFHIWGGLPWWASIVGAGLLVRLALLKPMLGAADTSTKINNLRDVSTPLRTKMTTAAREGKQTEMMQARMELNNLHAQHGVKPWKSFVPLLQVPLGFGCYRVVKGMTALPVPGLALESVGWIKDLTVADPYFVLPATTALFMYLSFRKGGESGINNLTNSSLGKMFLYGMPAMTFAFMSFFPSALQLYFVATGAFALGQSYLLASPGFRKFANIAIPQKAGGSAPGAGMSAEDQQKALRMIAEAMEQQKNPAAAGAAAKTPDPNTVSFIDRFLDSLKQSTDKTRKEVTEKMDELRGKGPQKNADGSPAAPPRLSENDRKLADAYEKRRREEEDWKREERNHARRQAHMRTLAAEREKARSSYKVKQR
ncbi:predicted protein [Aspergillus terreus NIH2624]|uniref:Membrane insertase YidC/Oxa/ALB C-terminal domain-containing protein n=1 Tax=Aspergillus terreus (strain NIH 2624 / FGSC A1156) TaxID=341663 RepID=Q0CE36_ASPTN|nr:uncharacterized protein ATEG_08048 [Aspergillus terreus NIH2624]EAU31221.1 predicted protein [Aspergillus terreus NIH2624]